MEKKVYLTESELKKIQAEKERLIIESFASNFNKIKRTDDSDVAPEVPPTEPTN